MSISLEKRYPYYVSRGESTHPSAILYGRLLAGAPVSELIDYGDIYQWAPHLKDKPYGRMVAHIIKQMRDLDSNGHAFLMGAPSHDKIEKAYNNYGLRLTREAEDLARQLDQLNICTEMEKALGSASDVAAQRLAGPALSDLEIDFRPAQMACLGFIMQEHITSEHFSSLYKLWAVVMDPEWHQKYTNGEQSSEGLLALARLSALSSA